jgi:hypothetical protein
MPVPLNPSLLPFHDIIPRPWSLAEFLANVERHRGRRLMLATAPLSLGVSGLWITTDAADLIVCRQAADPAQEFRTIGQMIAHLLLGHQATASHAASQVLFPHLDPSYVTAKLPVLSFDPADEMAADELAALLAAQALPAHSAQQRP